MAPPPTSGDETVRYGAPSTPQLLFLRETHTILAYLLFLAFLAHFGAVLFHTLIRATAS